MGARRRPALKAVPSGVDQVGMKPRHARRTEEIRQARIASVIAFVATVALVVLLSIAHAAQAAAPAPNAGPDPFAPLLFEEEDEEADLFDLEEEEELDPCEEIDDDLEFEECVEAEEPEEAEAEECILTSAVARVVARPKRGRLDLVVRYRSERPAAVTVRWRLRGPRGGLSLGTERARFSRSGAFRHRERLRNARQLRRALAAREFRVTVRAVNTPGHCRDDFDLRLRTRRPGPSWGERR